MIAKLKYEKARTAEERRRATSQPPASRYPGRMGTPVADFDRFKPSPLGVFVDQDDSSAPSVLESELSSVTPPPPPLSLAGVIPTDNGIVPILEVPVEDVEMADDDDRGRGSSLEPGEWFPGGSKASSGDDSGLYAHGEEDSTEGKPSFGDTSTTNASSPEALPAFVDSDIPRT